MISPIKVQLTITLLFINIPYKLKVLLVLAFHNYTPKDDLVVDGHWGRKRRDSMPKKNNRYDMSFRSPTTSYASSLSPSRKVSYCIEMQCKGWCCRRTTFVLLWYNLSTVFSSLPWPALSPQFTSLSYIFPIERIHTCMWEHCWGRWMAVNPARSPDWLTEETSLRERHDANRLPQVKPASI